MKIYIFASVSVENIRRGINNKIWAVAPMNGAQESARRTRAKEMPLGSPGLLYCSDPNNQFFTTPFITDSEPEDRAISGIWDETWYLPFKIRPIGELVWKKTWNHARISWPFLRNSDNPGGIVSAVRVFAPVPIHRHEWDVVLTDLGVNPEDYEDLW